jgi:heterotetrameric sarcosine oxidase gamma subunit
MVETKYLDACAVSIEPTGPVFQLIGRKSGAEALSTWVSERFGLELPEAPRLVQAGSLRILGIAPESWLIFGAMSDWLEVASIASCVDQSGAFMRVRLIGTSAQAILQKGVFIDLSLSAFTAEHVIVTSLAHCPVILLRHPIGLGIEVFVNRSYETGFLAWLKIALLAELTE